MRSRSTWQFSILELARIIRGKRNDVNKNLTGLGPVKSEKSIFFEKTGF